MKVYSINNTNFQSKVKMNAFLQEGLNSARASIERSEYKSLNEAKKFYDSLRNIASDTRVKEVSFDINREANEAFAFADGVKAASMQYNPNCCTGYISTQIVKQYADSLNFAPMQTVLDSYKQEYEILRDNLQRARISYQKQIETEMNELLKNITA